jgi:hypothetical protein
MESLEASWVGEIRIISVGFEHYVGVCSVLRGEVGGEIVEAAIVCFADEGDASKESFCSFWGRIYRSDVTKAVAALEEGA